MQKPLAWHWRSLPLHQRTGSEVFACLFCQDAIATLLESPYPSNFLSRYSLCAGSPRQLWTPALGEILPFLSSLLPQTRCDHLPDHLPFHGGWLGWLGYDLAWEIEKLPDRKADTLPFPVAYWYEPDSFAILDHQAQILWLAATKPEDLDKYEQSLTTNPDFELIDPHPSPLIFYTSQLDYEKAVKKALDYIRKGDIFQANLSLRFQSTTQAKGWQIYRSLQQINPSPFASYWRTPWGEMISCSPERLVKLERGIASTRPIAGTRPRGKTEALDRQLAEELLTNKKERAEHIMLVDLERNDLGRVCEWGSVDVDELLTIERYSHVMHLVSNVQGKLDKKYHAIDLIKALFPGGTITGCPKVRCLEIIEELEPMRRNLFYGSCGYIDLRGHLDLNILIRTLLMTTQGDLNTVWGQVGAGIVADSDPEKEWLESLHKAEAQLIALRSF
ncbi:MAG: anthranilate synthase component I [Microcystis aeruginosa Ma_MB_F_20061100_S20]|uniref:Anthranilate synthase component 1 n=1 Tax=Microcystis aeruginosa Ma_MB_F_20061100_S20D TaxID=2486253 RepID=A0A552EYT8_MICAE|nr:MAG: anthranilate synthase component I [Microcystis aeruginosa Ma_MB_F_20061100_S20D]TRU42729.1 MAG: anthranilate synthase component I [Microcystis aeruginosa Ma_MB_F_20061100_S20]